MFFSREKIEKFCKTLIEGLIREISAQTKLDLEGRFLSLDALEKVIYKKMDTKLDALQGRIDKAVDKLTNLGTELAKAGPEYDSDAKAIKDNDQKRTQLIVTQAKASNDYRDRTIKHLDFMEENTEKQTAAIESVADSLKDVAPVLGRLEQVLLDLTDAIDDIKKPAAVKKPKKKD